MTQASDVLDEALALLAATAPEFSNGNANHAPMVAETLSFLGHGDEVMRWLEGYRSTLDVAAAPRSGLDGWRDSLGRIEQWPEWAGLFLRELAEETWREVMARWVPRLAPGMAGAATHGIIRTGHAVRAVGERATPPRLGELASGLAYRAASYRELPLAAGNLSKASVQELLEGAPSLRPESPGNISQTLAKLAGLPQFATSIGSLKVDSSDPLVTLSDLTECFAGLYLANADEARSQFALVHAVTGPSAVRLMAPHLSAAASTLLVECACQVAAVIFSAYAVNRSPASVAVGEWQPTDLVENAIANGAAHAVKFTEACLREYEVNPKPIYLAAAHAASGRLRA